MYEFLFINKCIVYLICAIFIEILDLERFSVAEMTFNVVQGYLQWRCSTERQFPQHIPCLQIKLLVKTSIRQPKQINVAIKFYFLNILAETTLENALTLIIELESTKTNNVRIIELYCLILPSVPRCHDDDDDDEKTKTSKLPASETR